MDSCRPGNWCLLDISPFKEDINNQCQANSWFLILHNLTEILQAMKRNFTVVWRLGKRRTELWHLNNLSSWTMWNVNLWEVDHVKSKNSAWKSKVIDTANEKSGCIRLYCCPLHTRKGDDASTWICSLPCGNFYWLFSHWWFSNSLWWNQEVNGTRGENWSLWIPSQWIWSIQFVTK